MDEQRQEMKDAQSLLESWLKAATEFWGPMTKMWPGVPNAFETPSAAKGDGGTRMQESMASAFKVWQTLSTTMSDPEGMESFLRGVNSLPAIVSKMAQTGWKGFFRLQQQWMEKSGHWGEQTEAYKFENLDQEAFKIWNEMYEQEFRQFLNVPQLGLVRFYQERIGQTADKFNLFQTAMAEFLHLLYLPMEKSFKVMEEKLETLAQDGDLPESSRDYYQMWVKILEGHYMTLFKTPEYCGVLSKTLNAMEEFFVTRQKLLQDALQSLPVPTNEDMDELYKELYELKKKVKQLEKTLTGSGLSTKTT